MLTKNSYVDFVSDNYFEKCVKHVCDSFSALVQNIDVGELQKNGIDPFKMTFDMMNLRIDFDAWLKKEDSRQKDKTVNNTIGEFHQMLLGGVKGWRDLGTGDESHLDLQKNDDSIFMELKNRENTVNADSLAGVRKKLVTANKRFPNAQCYWGYIVAKNGKSEEKEWIYDGKKNNMIKRISGTKVYEIVTGDVNALENVWGALPGAIRKVCDTTYKFSEKDEGVFMEWFKQAFFRDRAKKK